MLILSIARSILSSSSAELELLIKEIKDFLPVPIEAVISDGQPSIRKAVENILPAAVHQLCHYHYLKEAIKPIIEAARHANKELNRYLPLRSLLLNIKYFSTCNLVFEFVLY